MKFLLAAAANAVLLLAVHASGVSRADVSPIDKVLSMLSDLEAKIIKEGEEAQKTYDEFTEWCEDRSRNLGFQIKDGKQQVEDNQATIDSATSDISSLNAKVEELASSISTNDADLQAATKIRNQEETTFKAQEKDLMEAADTLTRAVMILEKEMKKGGAVFAQLQKKSNNYIQALSVMLDASMIGSQDAAKLTSLVQDANVERESEDDGDDLGAPAAAKYEGHSGGILETLEDLLDKARESLASAREKETNNVQNFQMLKKSLEDEIKYAEKDMAETKKALADASEAKATADGDLSVASKDLSADQETMSTLKADCMEKAQDFEAEHRSRGEELKALATARKVISDSTSGANSLSYGLTQEDIDADDGDLSDLSDLTFLQVDLRIRSGVDLANFEAVRLVRDLARRMRSTKLMQLAQRMASTIRHSRSSGRDPFSKVKGLIKNMIESLEEDAQADASHKAYCDKEIAQSNEQKAEKTSTVDKLKAKMDKMMSKSAMLKDEVASLQKELAALASTQAEMNSIRSKEKSTYTKAKEEMEEGITGVKTALKVLRDYYAQDSDHDTADGAAGGIVGMLEVVESDFTKDLSEMTVAEQTSAAEYKKMTQENTVEKARKEQDVKYKRKEFKSLDLETSEAKSDKAATQEELDAINAYLEKLDEMCIAKPDTYSERKQRREAEIEGLKEALNILNGEAVLLQRQASLRGGRFHLTK